MWPEIVRTLAHQCKPCRRRSPKATPLFHAGRALQPPRLVPYSRKRVCTAVYCAIHRLPELDTLLGKEPLRRPRRRKDMKKANTRHVLAWSRRNTTAVSVQDMTVRSNLHTEMA